MGWWWEGLQKNELWAIDLPDEGVDLECGNIVHLLQGILDLALVGLDINEEDQGVVLLNLLHGRLGVEGSLQDLVLVQADNVVHGLALILGLTSKLEGLGAVEGGRGADLARLLTVDTLQGSLLGGKSLGLIRSSYEFTSGNRSSRGSAFHALDTDLFGISCHERPFL